MAVFIFSPEPDLEADRMESGLNQAGIQVIRWSGLDHCASIRFDESQGGFLDSVFLNGRKVCPADTVWIRTPPAHQDENSAFRQSLMMSLERSGAFCINKWSAAGRIGIKSFQLSLAKTCGLRIPATLLRNSGVTQSPVAGFDVRIVMLNRDFHAFRLTGEASGVGIERIHFPSQVESKLRRFAEHADITFGCFDMAVDADGEWWFLNLDANGEFLWMDDLLADGGLFESMLALLSLARAVSSE